MHIEKKVQMILSIIIISYNQREELRRCLDSILAMNLSFSYEIIVSDDRSTDGTFELAQEYKQKSVGGNLTRFVAVQCNSDEGNCANNSQRSGYNRCNAYPYAQGKYIAHVDADDYFRPEADVYERQVAALEKHPECALAMSRCQYLTVTSDEILTSSWNFGINLTEGQIISSHDFVRSGCFCINQVFMMRRIETENPVSLYGNRYVDSIITFHHLQYGGVVFVDACDYMYVQNEVSVTGEIWNNHNKDKQILWCLGIYVPALIPCWTQDFLLGQHYSSVRDVIKLAMSNYQLSSESYAGLESLHLFIYDCFGHKINLWERFRLFIIDSLLKYMKVRGSHLKFEIKLIHKLLFA